MYNDYRDVGGVNTKTQVDKIKKVVNELKKYESELEKSVFDLTFINKKLEGDYLKIVKKGVYEGRMATDLSKTMDDIKKTMDDAVKKSKKTETELLELISKLNKEAASLSTIKK
ncbi:hypothetical protein [Lachnobacterium bovis]|uniref:DUF5082 domain-containing protein n=1 Tax=Lachnobacterium bovis DSM 14045 TaxID=1122142 RepID=A0A1H3MUR7_9FIRM|nr:hypothetical protein [Lachnobacterium bovis]SDY80313.1 hypothetical protein SAMN02910414_02411 [Lachnobacterium bovis DSM 14045]